MLFEENNEYTVNDLITVEIEISTGRSLARSSLKKKKSKLNNLRTLPFRYNVRTERVVNFGDVPVHRLTQTNTELFISDLKTKLGYKNSTMIQYIDFLKIMLARAYKDRLLDIDIDLEEMSKKYKRKIDEETDPDPFTKTELSKLFPQPENISLEEAVFMIMVTTGMRVEEVMALSHEAIDTNNRQINVELAVVEGYYKKPKSKAGHRQLPLETLTEQAIDTLKKATSKRPAKRLDIQMSDPNKTRKEERHLIALNPKTSQFYCQDYDFRNAFKRLCKNRNVRYRGPSHLRHTYASHLLSNGVTIAEIASLLGHSNEEVTTRYAKWLPKLAAITNDIRRQQTLSDMFGCTPSIEVAPPPPPQTLSEEEKELLNTYRQMRQSIPDGLKITMNFSQVA